MATKSEIWDRIGALAREQGCELFDIDLPSVKSRTLRVYIWKGPGKDKDSGVLLDDCTQVAKKVLDIPDFDELFPGEVLIEVSSPGVNRRLRTPEHFKTAIGERIKVNTARINERGLETHGPVLKGKLLSFDGAVLSIETEPKQEVQSVDFALVRKAHVDFLFS